MKFEFAVYAEDPGAEPVSREYSDWNTVKAAKARAARLAKKHHGPVDLAHDDDRAWDDRYITTASATFMPDWHVPSSGRPDQGWAVTFERLD